MLFLFSFMSKYFLIFFVISLIELHCLISTILWIFQFFLYWYWTSFACMLSHSVVSDSLRPYGLWPTRLLCPWNFPGKNTRVGCHFLLQGIFPSQGTNPSLLWLLHWPTDSLSLSHLGSLTTSFSHGHRRYSEKYIFKKSIETNSWPNRWYFFSIFFVSVPQTQ